MRTEAIIKWLVYAAATAALLALQGAVENLRLWGTMPFLYPAMAAIAASFEGPVGGTAYALALGVVCDATIPAPLPCFYTLCFPLTGLLSGLIACSWLPSGFGCAVVTGLMAFAITGVFHILLLWPAHGGAWVALRETGAALPFFPIVYLLFRAVHRKCQWDE